MQWRYEPEDVPSFEADPEARRPVFRPVYDGAQRLPPIAHRPSGRPEEPREAGRGGAAAPVPRPRPFFPGADGFATKAAETGESRRVDLRPQNVPPAWLMTDEELRSFMHREAEVTRAPPDSAAPDAAPRAQPTPTEAEPAAEPKGPVEQASPAAEPSPTEQGRQLTPVQESARARLVRVVDGDTFDAYVTIGGFLRPIRVRLAGVDAPELGIDVGQKAKAELEQLLNRGDIRLANLRYDEKNNRYVAEVSVPGVPNVSDHLAERGLVSGWLGAPPDWPPPNEFRHIWRYLERLDPANLAKWKNLVAMRRKFGVMRRSGQWPTEQQLQEFRREADKFMREVVRPIRQRRGLIEPDGASRQEIDPQSPISADIPYGRAEWHAWYKSLHPHERERWNTYVNLKRRYEEIILKHPGAGKGARTNMLMSPNPVAILGNRSYPQLLQEMNQFLHATMRRYRQHQRELESSGRGRRRRRRAPRARLSDAALLALGAA